MFIVTVANRCCATWQWMGRVAAALSITACLLVGSAVPAAADPATAATTSDAAAVAAWPVDLQQLVAGTSAFTAAPWFTEGDCAGRGGDVARYINIFFQREGRFLQALLTDMARQAPDLITPEVIAAAAAPDAVFPNGNPAYTMPEGVCAEDLRAWSAADQDSPWGFTWAARPDPDSVVVMTRDAAGRPGDPGDPEDAVDPLTVCVGDESASYLCSRAFFVNCELAAAAEQNRCQQWNVAVQRHLNGLNHWADENTDVLDRIGNLFSMIGGALWAAGKWVISALGWVLGKVGDAVGWVTKKGMEQVVAFFVSGAVWLWGQVTSWLIDQSTPNLVTGGFVTTYNIVAGLMIAVSFLIWLAGLLTAWRRGRLAGSLIGAVKAVVGIQLVGIIAALMLLLANEATKALIDSHGAQISSSRFTDSALQVNPTIGLVAAILTIFGLIGTAIILFFQAPLTLGHALFGTVAAAGQAHHATSHWTGRWFIKLLSLSWCKFFMVGMTILAQNLMTSSEQNMAQNTGQQIFAVLSGMTLMVLLPTTPWLLGALMSVTLGYASAAADRLSMGFTMAAGEVALDAGMGLAARGGTAALNALSTMGSNLSDLDKSAGSFGRVGGSAAPDDGGESDTGDGADGDQPLTDAEGNAPTGGGGGLPDGEGDPGPGPQPQPTDTPAQPDSATDGAAGRGRSRRQHRVGRTGTATSGAGPGAAGPAGDSTATPSPPSGSAATGGATDEPARSAGSEGAGASPGPAVRAASIGSTEPTASAGSDGSARGPTAAPPSTDSPAAPVPASAAAPVAEPPAATGDPPPHRSTRSSTPPQTPRPA
jgi:hypothetical protein